MMGVGLSGALSTLFKMFLGYSSSQRHVSLFDAYPRAEMLTPNSEGACRGRERDVVAGDGYSRELKL